MRANTVFESTGINISCDGQRNLGALCFPHCYAKTGCRHDRNNPRGTFRHPERNPEVKRGQVLIRIPALVTGEGAQIARIEQAREDRTSNWVAVLLLVKYKFNLHKGDFRDSLLMIVYYRQTQPGSLCHFRAKPPGQK